MQEDEVSKHVTCAAHGRVHTGAFPGSRGLSASARTGVERMPCAEALWRMLMFGCVLLRLGEACRDGGRDRCELLVQLSLVVVMVTLIHFIEAYGLNPAIYSAHLKLHPLLVLTVLVVAEHSLGVWGLLLAGQITLAIMLILRTRKLSLWLLSQDSQIALRGGGCCSALPEPALCM